MFRPSLIQSHFRLLISFCFWLKDEWFRHTAGRRGQELLVLCWMMRKNLTGGDAVTQVVIAVKPTAKPLMGINLLSSGDAIPMHGIFSFALSLGG